MSKRQFRLASWRRSKGKNIDLSGNGIGSYGTIGLLLRPIGRLKDREGDTLTTDGYGLRKFTGIDQPVKLSSRHAHAVEDDNGGD